MECIYIVIWVPWYYFSIENGETKKNLCAILIQSLFIILSSANCFANRLCNNMSLFRNQHSIMLYLFYKYENNQMKRANIARRNINRLLAIKIIISELLFASSFIPWIRDFFSFFGININRYSSHISILRISFVYHLTFFFFFSILFEYKLAI